MSMRVILLDYFFVKYIVSKIDGVLSLLMNQLLIRLYSNGCS